MGYCSHSYFCRSVSPDIRYFGCMVRFSVISSRLLYKFFIIYFICFLWHLMSVSTQLGVACFLGGFRYATLPCDQYFSGFLLSFGFKPMKKWFAFLVDLTTSLSPFFKLRHPPGQLFVLCWIEADVHGGRNAEVWKAWDKLSTLGLWTSGISNPHRFFGCLIIATRNLEAGPNIRLSSCI